MRERLDLSWGDWSLRANRYLSHLESILCPDVFIVGGGISTNPEKWIPRLNTKAPLKLAALRNNAGIVGAAAQHLSEPIPSVRGLGVPGAGYPFAWSVYDWIDGSTATRADIADQAQFAEQLADFLVSLRSIDPADGPKPGIHNWYRGATLLTYDATARRAFDALTGHIDVDLAAWVWADALAAPWDGADVWFHGDLAEGNLLLRDGQLAAVIDFGTCGVGDPSCDLGVAWTLLSEPGRRHLKDRLQVDEATWSRGRGWALWKTLASLASAITNDDEPEIERLMHVCSELFEGSTEAP